MDKKQMVIGAVVALVLMGGWWLLQAYWARKHPEWFVAPPPSQQAAGTTQPASTQPTTGVAEGTTSTGPTTMAGTGATTGPSLHAGFEVAASTPAAEPATMGSDKPNDPTWPMQIVLDPTGASFSSVKLNAFKHPADFQKPVKDRRVYQFEEPYAGLPGTQPLGTRTITVNKQTVNLLAGEGGKQWAREGDVETTAAYQRVKYSLTLTQNGVPALKLTKTFTIVPKSAANEGSGYEVRVDCGMENLSGQELTVKTTFNGPTLPPREASRPPDRQLLAGYRNDMGRAIDVAAHPVESFAKDKPTIDLTYSKSEGRPVGWAGASSVYFSAFVLTVTPDGKGPGEFFSKVTATQHDAADPNISPEDKPVELSFETSEQKLGPGESKSLRLQVFLGPRWGEVLTQQHYDQFPRDYDATLVIKSGMCAWCTFDFLIVGLVYMLRAFWYVTRDWGLAIIVLVCIVRLLLHPITKRSQIQMMGMSKMGPELERLKKKHGDNKEELNKAMMQYYKQQGFAPILGCLPMFLQTPIWIALYSSLQTTFELRQAPFLWGFTWIKDLAKPDFLIHFNHAMPVPVIGWFFTSWTMDGINILPVLLALVFWLQQRFSPKPAAMTPEQQQQQKMMQWMTLLFPVMLYNGPSGLNLYILTSTTIGIIESKIIRDHIKQREAAEKAGMVIVDAKPTRAGKRLARDEDAPRKRGGLFGWLAAWWAGIQEKVEQARNEQQRGGGGKRKA